MGVLTPWLVREFLSQCNRHGTTLTADLVVESKRLQFIKLNGTDADDPVWAEMHDGECWIDVRLPKETVAAFEKKYSHGIGHYSRDKSTLRATRFRFVVASPSRPPLSPSKRKPPPSPSRLTIRSRRVCLEVNDLSILGVGDGMVRNSEGGHSVLNFRSGMGEEATKWVDRLEGKLSGTKADKEKENEVTYDDDLPFLAPGRRPTPAKKPSRTSTAPASALPRTDSANSSSSTPAVPAVVAASTSTSHRHPGSIDWSLAPKPAQPHTSARMELKRRLAAEKAAAGGGDPKKEEKPAPTPVPSASTTRTATAAQLLKAQADKAFAASRGETDWGKAPPASTSSSRRSCQPAPTAPFAADSAPAAAPPLPTPQSREIDWSKAPPRSQSSRRSRNHPIDAVAPAEQLIAAAAAPSSSKHGEIDWSKAPPRSQSSRRPRVHSVDAVVALPVTPSASIAEEGTVPPSSPASSRLPPGALPPPPPKQAVRTADTDVEESEVEWSLQAEWPPTSDAEEDEEPKEEKKEKDEEMVDAEEDKLWAQIGEIDMVESFGAEQERQEKMHVEEDEPDTDTDEENEAVAASLTQPNPAGRPAKHTPPTSADVSFTLQPSFSATPSNQTAATASSSATVTAQTVPPPPEPAATQQSTSRTDSSTSLRPPTLTGTTPSAQPNPSAQSTVPPRTSPRAASLESMIPFPYSTAPLAPSQPQPATTSSPSRSLSTPRPAAFADSVPPSTGRRPRASLEAEARSRSASLSTARGASAAPAAADPAVAVADAKEDVFSASTSAAPVPTSKATKRKAVEAAPTSHDGPAKKRTRINKPKEVKKRFSLDDDEDEQEGIEQQAGALNVGDGAVAREVEVEVPVEETTHEEEQTTAVEAAPPPAPEKSVVDDLPPPVPALPAATTTTLAAAAPLPKPKSKPRTSLPARLASPARSSSPSSPAATVRATKKPHHRHRRRTTLGLTSLSFAGSFAFSGSQAQRERLVEEQAREEERYWAELEERKRRGREAHERRMGLSTAA
ncbi:hypothetical protein JCM8097_009573 [Rhodosporidiobolus ruineniae]